MTANAAVRPVGEHGVLRGLPWIAVLVCGAVLTLFVWFALRAAEQRIAQAGGETTTQARFGPPLPGFYQPIPYGSWLALGMGILLTAVCAAYLRSNVNRRLTTERTVAERTRALNAALLNAEENEAHYRKLIEVSPECILVSRDFTIVIANPAAARLFKVAAPEDLIGKRVTELLPPDQRELAESLQAKLEQSECRLPVFEGKILCADGSVVDTEQATCSFREDSGVTIQAILRDISERKRLQANMLRTRELAEDAVRTKSQFLANMSHEIRTPMNGIMGMAGLLLAGNLDPRQRKRAETLRDSAEGLLNILNDLLDFSRMEAHKLKLEETAFDLRSVVEGVADLMAVKAQEKGVELLCFIEPDVPTGLLGDSSRLRQILVNLTGNAVKFTSVGEISIRVKLETPGDPRVLRFEVQDTGIGIPEDKRSLLFQPFSQVDTSSTRRYRGTGLGLSIVRMLADRMGGKVGLDSEEGKGSCFWFTVALRGQPSLDRPRKLSLAGWRVLVVDDNAASRGLMMELLSFWQVSATEACNAKTALDLLDDSDRGPFDAVLVDLEMPGVDGEQLGSLIRQRPELSASAMVLLTPLRLAADAERWRRQGFAGHVCKPVKQGELGTCLGTILGYGPAPSRPSAASKPTLTSRQQRSLLHLLVVEDNPVNQEVALGILENLGYRADVAGDGLSALRALSQTDYDLVLMDCQLPDMDGYEVARRIRQTSTPVRNHDVPIIAATAHAMAGDREKCLAAGMNDYISKPIRSDTLEQTLEAWTCGKTPYSKSSPVSLPAALPVEASVVFDREGFVERLMGNEELAQRIVSGFMDDMPRQLTLLARAVENVDAAALRLVAHSIKGAASNVGGLEVQRIARKLEETAKSGDLSAAAGDLAELSDSFQRAKPVMESFLR